MTLDGHTAVWAMLNQRLDPRLVAVPHGYHRQVGDRCIPYSDMVENIRPCPLITEPESAKTR